MALIARHRPVCPHQWEFRVVVREGRRPPYRRRMTRLAVRRKAARYVRGVGCGCELCFVAGVTIRRSRFKVRSLVTRIALDRFVGTRERKSRECVVIETGSPRGCRHSVALLTVGGESGACMIWVGRTDKIGTMATNACCGSSNKTIARCSRVTVFAWECCVFADQGKASRLVFLDHVGNLPRFGRMTSQAIRTEFGFVNVCMA